MNPWQLTVVPPRGRRNYGKFRGNGAVQLSRCKLRVSVVPLAQVREKEAED